MELTAKCVLLSTSKKVSKKDREYVLMTLLGNSTGEAFSTFSYDLKMLELDKLKEYAFTFVYNSKYKDIKVTGLAK